MTIGKRRLARSAWTAFLVLFAVRAIAGTALCQWYGQHEFPAGASHAAVVHAPSTVAPDECRHQGAFPTDQPSHDRDGHVCEESVYLNNDPASLSVSKLPLPFDAMPWSHAPARDWKPVAVVVSVAPQQPADAPPPRSPLDISPRLRI